MYFEFLDTYLNLHHRRFRVFEAHEYGSLPSRRAPGGVFKL